MSDPNTRDDLHSDDTFNLEPEDPSTRSNPPLKSPESYGHTSASHRSPKTCPKCGYSLAGLPTTQCPECGQRADRSLTGADRAAANRIALGKEYLISGLIVLASFGVLAVILAMRNDINDFPMFMLRYVVIVPIGFAVFFGCSLAWIGFDQPLGISAIRLAAIFALVDCVSLLLAGIPVWYIAAAARVLVSAGLMSKWLDLDFQDAILVTLFIMVVQFVVVLVIFHQLQP